MNALWAFIGDLSLFSAGFAVGVIWLRWRIERDERDGWDVRSSGSHRNEGGFDQPTVNGLPLEGPFYPGRVFRTDPPKRGQPRIDGLDGAPKR